MDQVIEVVELREVTLGMLSNVLASRTPIEKLNDLKVDLIEPEAHGH